MQESQVLRQPFSNVQLELLKLYASNISDEDLIIIRDMMARYFFEKAKDSADKAWLEKGLNEEMILNDHRRRPYPSKK